MVLGKQTLLVASTLYTMAQPGRKDGLVVRMLEQDSRDLGLIPRSAINSLYDIGQVTYCPFALVPQL